jgi:hypothetical protein
MLRAVRHALWFWNLSALHASVSSACALNIVAAWFGS